METAVCAHPRVDKCEATVRRFGDSSMELQAIFWADYKTAEEFNRLVSDLHLALKEGLDRADIGFVYPATIARVKSELPKP
jgi:hypothetical protein